MAGIYIHIPFCKQACHYCNFHFSTTTHLQNELIDALVCELEFRKNELENQPVETIYFGGGTPSLLNKQQLEKIISCVYKNYQVQEKIECTLEANPDDINNENLVRWKHNGINRLSIGIQSFFDEDLLYMNRTHTGNEAKKCIELAIDNGFENFSVDLIFGYPLLSNQKWQSNIELVTTYQVPHLSCYAMTVEPNTALNHFIKTKKNPPINAEQSAEQFEYLMNQLTTQGYEHYEISNYAQPGKRAIHNSNYWKGKNYIGIGPSAHSYDGKSRQWNVANNVHYVKGIHANKPLLEKEILTFEEKINEHIMIGLRVKEGFDVNVVEQQLMSKQITEFKKTIQHFENEQYILIQNEHIILTQKGKLFADYIASELFI